MTTPASSTRERIIDAAIGLFADHGYPNTSMNNIAKAVGIKSASIYNHFSSKEEILDTILNEYIDYAKKNIISVAAIDDLIETTDPKTIISGLFFSFSADTAIRYTKILKVITHEQFREPKATEFIRDHLLGENQEHIKIVLDKLVAAGKIRPIKTALYARQLISLSLTSSIETMFYGLEEYRKRNRVTGSEARQFIIDQIVSGVE